MLPTTCKAPLGRVCGVNNNLQGVFDTLPPWVYGVFDTVLRRICLTCCTMSTCFGFLSDKPDSSKIIQAPVSGNFSQHEKQLEFSKETAVNIKLNLTDEQIRLAIEKERARTRRNGGVLANNELVVEKFRASGLSYESISRIFSENGIKVSKEAVRRYFERHRNRMNSYEKDVPPPNSIPVISVKGPDDHIQKPENKLFGIQEMDDTDDDLIPSPDDFRRRLEFD